MVDDCPKTAAAGIDAVQKAWDDFADHVVGRDKVLIDASKGTGVARNMCKGKYK